MQASDRLIELLIAEEGLVTRAYRDVVGVLTIGVGHTSAAGGLKVVAGMEITRDEATQLLRKDLVKYWGEVVARMGPSAQDHELEGGASFHFNTGAINTASWVDWWFLSDEAFETERRFKLWNKAGGKRIEGLVRRRAREADIIFRNVWPVGYDQNISGTVTQLTKLGYLSREATSRTDIFVAIKSFQSDYGLKVDGIIGPATRASLMRAVSTQTNTRVAAGGGAASGAGSLAADIGARSGDMLTGMLPLAIGLGVVVAVLAAGWAWRNRGRFGLGHIKNPKVEMSDA